MKKSKKITKKFSKRVFTNWRLCGKLWEKFSMGRIGKIDKERNLLSIAKF
jgi:hypothetical protein